MKSKLLLFDIDGTLITSGGAGERALRLALHEHLSIDDDLKDIEIAGRTDTGITRRIFDKHGLSHTPESQEAFLQGYLDALGRMLPITEGRLLPGVSPLLDALAQRNENALGLLTGNLERGARLKLTHYGIWHYFAFGAYADDHCDRNQLGPFAQSRATQLHGCAFAPESTWIIGDTPHDIACARAIGARAVAVATGIFTHAQLAEYEPDVLLEDFSDLDAVLAAFQ